VVKVTRDGESYYVGVGLSQQSYELGKPDAYWGDCSINWKGACAESWAHRLAGERLSMIQQATDRFDLIGKLANSPENHTRGFGTHVHTVGTGSVVLADGFQNASVGQATSNWLATVGLSADDLDSAASSSGYRWLGPFSKFRVRPSASPQPHYLLFVPVPIEDRLTTDPGDGTGDRFNLIVPVSASNPRFDRNVGTNTASTSPSTAVGDRAGCDQTALQSRYACVDHAQFKSKCSRTSKTEQCPADTVWANVPESLDCMQDFYDFWYSRDGVAQFNSNSEFGLMAWEDATTSIMMCGCAAGYEAAIVPAPPKAGNATLIGASQCKVGAAGNDPAVVDMHTPFYMACAESSEAAPIVAIVLGIVLPLLFLVLIAWLYMRYKYQKERAALLEQIEQFQDAVREGARESV
jgi:hypothetical protein